MPRRARRENETSFFHVIVQGIEKKNIFNKREYIERYMDLLFYEKKKYFSIKLLSYCIMSNHAHILLGVDNIKSLSMYMKSVNTRFAMYYNEEEKRVGYVFRDRFRSEAIYNQEYLYKCLAYIHLNPVEAKIVVEPGDYKYSSYNDFIYRTGIASKENLRIIFGSSEDYMELFNFIHYGVYDFKDYKENKFDTDDEIHSFVDKYMKNISINSVNLFENNALLIELCRTLNNQGVSNSKIEELFHIKRKKIEGLYRRFPKGSVPLVKNLPKGSVPEVKNLPKGSVPEVKNLPKRSVPVVKNSPTGSVPVGKEVSDAS